MRPVPDSPAVPAGHAVANDYDGFAEAYSAENEGNLFNAYYKRPATLALAGDVAGRRILDAGARELFPDILADKPAFPCFLFFVLEAV
jgi:hypothetical protein